MPKRDGHRPTVMLVGTGHWSNPGKDYQAADYGDMLAPKRQEEIRAALGQLAAFAPTKIALEVMPDRTDDLDDDYRRFRAGDLSLTADERHQIGFRLSAKMGHDRVFGIDWHDLDRDIGWDVAVVAAQRLGQDDLVTAFTKTSDDDKDEPSTGEMSLRDRTVSELLLDASDPMTLAGNHQVYMDLARVGLDNDYIGADVVLRWYDRNLKIFVNLCRIINSPEDRVLVLIGAGHLPLLRHFLEEAGAFAVVPARSWLG